MLVKFEAARTVRTGASLSLKSAGELWLRPDSVQLVGVVEVDGEPLDGAAYIQSAETGDHTVMGDPGEVALRINEALEVL